jgi:hypothetical protein
MMGGDKTGTDERPVLPKCQQHWEGINQHVCNFTPKVLRKIEMRDTDNTVTCVAIKLCFEDGESDEIVIPLSDLKKTDWYTLDQRCIFTPNCRNPGRYVENEVRRQLGRVPTEIQHRIDCAGLKCIDGERVFVAGERVVSRSSNSGAKPKVNLDNVKVRLDIDSELTENEAFRGMRELISLSPEIGRVLVAHVISGIIRAAFKEAGFNPCNVLMVIGKSGMLKSHYVPHLVQLYNRSDGIKAVTRFNSSQSFIEKIVSEYSECTAVIDDLHSAASKGIKNRNEDTAEEIIRRISDDTGRGHKEGNTLVQGKFRGNVVFIGEYVFGQESTIPRALVVELTRRPDGMVLDKYQRQQPLLVSTFYFFLIRWYVEHFDEIRNEIDIRLTKFRETMVHSAIHGRLCDTQFYLQFSYMVFLEFCVESGFISEEDSSDEYNDFQIQISKLVRMQQERLRPDNEAESINYYKIILKLYRQGRFHLAGKREAFNPDKHDGLLYYNCLCLRSKSLDKKLCKVVPGFNHESCIKFLIEKGVLKRGKQKNTVQINGVGGKRFYAIKFSEPK